MAPTSNGNGKTPWSAIETVDARQITKGSQSFVAGLWIELLKRLEKTPRSEALTVTFADAKEGQAAVTALRRLRKLDGLDGQVEITNRCDGSQRILYVRRSVGYAEPTKHAVKDFD